MNKEEFKNKLQEVMTLEEYKAQKLEQIKSKEDINNMLNQANDMLFEQMKRLRDLDVTKKEIAETEISRGNALSNTSKSLLQTIGVQMAIQKQIGL